MEMLLRFIFTSEETLGPVAKYLDAPPPRPPRPCAPTPRIVHITSASVLAWRVGDVLCVSKETRYVIPPSDESPCGSIDPPVPRVTFRKTLSITPTFILSSL